MDHAASSDRALVRDPGQLRAATAREARSDRRLQRWQMPGAAKDQLPCEALRRAGAGIELRHGIGAVVDQGRISTVRAFVARQKRGGADIVMGGTGCTECVRERGDALQN